MAPKPEKSSRRVKSVFSRTKSLAQGLLIVCACARTTPPSEGATKPAEPAASDNAQDTTSLSTEQLIARSEKVFAGMKRACPDMDRREPRTTPACTMVGCFSGYSLKIDPRTRWPQGRYRFEFMVDHERVVCEASVPTPCTPTLACKPAKVVEMRFCPSEDEHQNVVSASVDFPETLSLTVYINGERADEVRPRPEYHVSRPNGPGCGPACCWGGNRVRLFESNE